MEFTIPNQCSLTFFIRLPKLWMKNANLYNFETRRLHDWKCASSAQVLSHAILLTWGCMMECFKLKCVQRCTITSNPNNGPSKWASIWVLHHPSSYNPKIKPTVRIVFSYPHVTPKVQIIIVLESHILNHILVCNLIEVFVTKERIGFLSKQSIAIFILVAVIVFVAL